jgi:hypothetical protein
MVFHMYNQRTSVPPYEPGSLSFRDSDRGWCKDMAPINGPVLVLILFGISTVMTL